MLTIRRMTAGYGYRYLLESVAVGDGRADHSTPLTSYYAESGNPPGRFRGAGLHDLGIEPGTVAGEDELYNMVVRGTHPLTGELVGRQKPRTPANPDEPGKRHPVAGFDLTFSPSKSVSTMWALADADTKARIYELHEQAIDRTLAYAEGNLWHSRSGKGGIVQEDIQGVAAVSFTHYDSRAGDPQLHDHVLVWNTAKSLSDGEYRTLDSRGLYKSVVTLGVLHEGILSDLLTAEFGTGWEVGQTRGGMQKIEMVGMPPELIREFSQRVEAKAEAEEVLVARFLAERGREPTKVERTRLAQQANLQTRQDKQHRSLEEMTADWRRRASAHIGQSQEAWVATLKDRNDLPLLRADDLSDEMLVEVGAVAVNRAAERRATFSRLNLMTEAGRQLEGVRFASPEDRIAVIERATELASQTAVSLSPPQLRRTPERFRRADGSSRLRPADHQLFTSAELLDAEQRLVDTSRRLDGPAASAGTVAEVAEANLAGKDYKMSADQALAVEKVATSGRRLDVLVGPAGTGKSTTMSGLRAVWESEHGRGSVIGLAPSANAAEVLGEELGIPTENTAKWLWEHDQQAIRRSQINELRRVAVTPDEARSKLASTKADLNRERRKSRPDQGRVRDLEEQARYYATFLSPSARAKEIAKVEKQMAKWQLRPGQLLIVDESSLAGTFALDRLVSAASEAGAKVLLLGDTHQLGAVDAGGAFRLLVKDRDGLVPQLTDVRRFKNRWEKAASTELRLGHSSALDSYDDHDRFIDGDRAEMMDSLYEAWHADIAGGKSSLMIAADTDTVSALNRRARRDRILAGEVVEHGLEVADGQTAGVGDEVVTRKNDRRLPTGRRGWVKNGDRWTVTATNDDGSMVVSRAGAAGGSVTLPADYVAENVELGYAVTAYRAQGRTVDTAHAMVTATTTREVAYVMLTRGRETNRAYIDTYYDPDPQTSHEGQVEPQTWREVMEGVLANESAERSAIETQRALWDHAESIPTLLAEYQTIMRAAQQERWDALIESCGLTPEQVEAVRASDAYGPLLHGFAHAEARGVTPEEVLGRLVAARTLVDADDIASVLHGRLDRYVDRAGSKRNVDRHMIAGLAGAARNVDDDDMARALEERAEAMERRATVLAEQALERRPAWLDRLGAPPADPERRHAWLRQVRVVAAYRELYNVTDVVPIQSEDLAHSSEEIGHQKRATEAARRALAIARQDTPTSTPHTYEPVTIDTTRGIEP